MSRWLLLSAIFITSALGMLVHSERDQAGGAQAETPLVNRHPQQNEPRRAMWVSFPAPQSQRDHRSDYSIHLLKRVMEVTVADFGAYQFSLAQAMSRERQLTELRRNKLVTVTDNPANREWDKHVAPIVFPTRRGLQSYRLLLIDRSKRDLFAKVDSVEKLKALKAGVKAHWQIGEILERNQFQIVKGNDYEGLFKMLTQGRFDYFPRSLLEISQELEERSKSLPSLTIAPKLALHIPSPTFFYVNKNNQKLHSRIATGLERLHQNGELERLFADFHQIQRIRDSLRGRKILSVENPFISADAIYQQPEFWFKIGTAESTSPTVTEEGHAW